MSTTSWSPDDIPDLTGTRALVTGVTGGLGFYTALELLRHGADIVMTARNTERARPVVDRLRQEVPGGVVGEIPMDLANLASVRHAAELTTRTYDRIDILVNNAGVMAAPQRVSADGLELQIATNHLGHFAWTAALWPLLAESATRVVTVSSLMHSMAQRVDLRSLTISGTPRRYRRWRSYAESKLANLFFAVELDRRIRAAGLDVTSVAAHPGYASTNLTVTGPRLEGWRPWSFGMHQVTRAFGQSARAGAWPLLMAATMPNLAGGSYVGPGRLKQTRGKPQLVEMASAARNHAKAAELWTASERAVGIDFEVEQRSAFDDA